MMSDVEPPFMGLLAMHLYIFFGEMIKFFAQI